MEALYRISIWLYGLVIRMAAPVHEKARLWLSGRKETWGYLEKKIPADKEVHWFHCASLGEFEQGKPVMEAMMNAHPEVFILVTFFSPSGYVPRKNHPVADAVCYLPEDKPGHVNCFLNLVKPKQAYFIKYEFWHGYLRELKRRSIPVINLSGVFRPNQRFFKWYGGFFFRDLQGFRHFFVQDHASARCLESAGIKQVTISGDTRFDRVREIAEASETLPLLDVFAQDRKVVVAGSCWPTEEHLIYQVMKSGLDTKWVLAPHDVGSHHIDRMASRLPLPFVRYSEATPETLAQAQVLLVDQVGLLSRIYKYGHAAIVGGGFSGKLHNILEPAAFGLPVLWGPRHRRFWEAEALIEKGGGFVFTDGVSLLKTLTFVLEEPFVGQMAGEVSRQFVRTGSGATRIIMEHLFPVTA
ncbi:MAG: 3-deoxy-D-manno-octulosonic acid transferase [Flavobacteriales bacterium]|nr:3-deoxy-D-manno-octulosonic acid transferase [Flavobacteriales bacterium]MCB9447026.1 3-deoxy-D-manno-octulosonic acid transferase [Flavobacteriales bacterium]